MTLLDADAFCVAWALQKNKPWHPLLVCSHRNLLYIFDVKTQKFVGCLRGHGGEITSIAARPDQPHIFCSTSRDFTARIYDLTLRPQQEPANVHWPPYKDPNKAGPAFGLHMTDNEGPAHGIGRCIAVTGAQRSGGHRAAVLHAAWHPDLPVLATCGIDRCAKLWYIPPCKDGTKIRRLDQPIFSTSMLHAGRVMSIAWLGRDVLLTHGGPALFRLEVEGENEQESTHTQAQTQTQAQTSTQADDQTQEDTKEIEYEYDTASGDFKLWQWLSIDRFFPPVYFQHEPPERMVVPLADYKESSSFRILATRPFVDGPQHVWQGHRAHVHPLHDSAPPTSPNSPSHSAWLAFHLLPGAPSVQFFNPAHMDVFEVEPLEWVREDAEVAELAAKRLRIGDEVGGRDGEGTSAAGGGAGRSGSAGGGLSGNGSATAGEEVPDSQPNPPPTWEVKLQANGVGEEKAAACTVGMGGQALAVVSDLGSVWIWRRKER
ncbi:WD40-repeat-containing domain protein [Schizophyllum commune]